MCHEKGSARDRIDQAQLPRTRYAAATMVVIPVGGARRVRNIETRILRRTWEHSPETAGETLVLAGGSEAKARAWLQRNHNINIGAADPVTRRLLTPSTVDNLRWIAAMALGGRISDLKVGKRVAGR